MNEKKELTGDLLLKLLFYDNDKVVKKAVIKAADEIFESDTPILSVELLTKKYLKKGRFSSSFYERLNQRLEQENDEEHNHRVFDFYKYVNGHKPDLIFVYGFIDCVFSAVPRSKSQEWIAYLNELNFKKEDYEDYAKRLFEKVADYPALWDIIINRIPNRKNECIYMSSIFDYGDDDLLVEVFKADRKKFMEWSKKIIGKAFDPAYFWGMIIDNLWSDKDQKEIEAFLIDILKSMNKGQVNEYSFPSVDKIWDKLSDPKIKLYEKLSDKAKIEIVESLLSCENIKSCKFVDLIDLLNRVRDPEFVSKAFYLSKLIVIRQEGDINIMPPLLAVQRYLFLSNEDTVDIDEVVGLLLSEAFVKSGFGSMPSMNVLFKVLRKMAASQSPKTAAVVPDLLQELLLLNLGRDFFLSELLDFLQEMPIYQKMFIKTSSAIIREGKARPQFIEEITSIKEDNKNYPLVSKLLKLSAIKSKEKKIAKKQQEAEDYLSLLK